MALRVAFVRHRGRRDRIYVTRQDSTTASWDFPSYGDDLPHDLVHLVVESALGIGDGFWGLLDAGVDVTLVDNQAKLVREGRPLVDEPGFDASGLIRAEEAVAVVGAPDELSTWPDRPSPTQVAALRGRLADLAEQWRQLDDGTALSLLYPGRGS
jgi:hypothetical protein